MTKRRAAFNPDQMAFDLEPPSLPSDGMLAGFDRKVASAVSLVLKEDDRDRWDVAAAMSRILDADVPKSMLDAYSAESKEDHNISFARMLVLIATTGRHDVLRSLLRPFGLDLVVGEEILLVEMGHLESQKREIERRLKELKTEARPLKRGGTRK